MIHDEVLKAAYNKAEKTYDFAPMLSLVADDLADADLTVVNVDGVLKGGKVSGYPSFSTPPSLLNALLESGVDMLTLANNHALDFGFEGLKKTIENCEAYGMDFIGGARTKAERQELAIREINGTKIGFLNYTEVMNGDSSYFGKNALEYGILKLQKGTAGKDIRALREAGADVVIVYVHWGTEYQTKPDANQKKYAKKLAEAGADVILGSHPHMLQGAVWIETEKDGAARHTLCVYSMGNFLADKRSEKRDTGMIFEITVQETPGGSFEITQPMVIPTYIWRYGGGSGNYDFRVVACDDWFEERPDKMSEAVQKKLRAAYQGAAKVVGDAAALRTR